MNKPYQEEDSFFTSNGIKYDLNIIFKAVHAAPSGKIEINKLKWIFRYAEPLNLDRVEASDITIPILVTPERGRLIVVDGIHRLYKACLAGDVLVLPCKTVPRAVMKSAIVVDK